MSGNVQLSWSAVILQIFN